MSAQPDILASLAIRPMRTDDLDAVCAIEDYVYDFPWSRGIFNDCLLAGYSCVVLEGNGEVMGYAIMSAAAAEGHILNLCINSHLRCQGRGRKLLDYLLARAAALNMERLFLEVRPSNTAAIALYDSAGFDRLGTRRGYYQALDGREDALVFVREFGGEEDSSV